MALKADGTVAAWGDDDAASQVPDGLSNVVAISCKDYNVALKSDGSIVAWGRNSRSESAVFSGLSGVVAVSAQFVVKSDGTIGAWSFQARGLLLLGQEFRMWPSSPRVEVISLL